MELRQSLNFTDARIVSISSYPSDKGPKCVVVLAASLLPAEAEALGCGYIYRDGIPVGGLEDVALDGQLRDMELQLPTPQDRNQYDTYFPELIYKLKAKRVEDAKFEISFRVHESSKRVDLDALLESVNKDTFACVVRARQGQLFGESGTRVEMSKAATATESGSSETTPAEPETEDRSYETRPRGGRRKKVQSISEGVVEEQADPEEDGLPFIN